MRARQKQLHPCALIIAYGVGGPCVAHRKQLRPLPFTSAHDAPHGGYEHQNDVPSLLPMVAVALAGRMTSNSTHLLPLLLTAPVALAGHIIRNSAHLPLLLLMVVVALAGHAVSDDGGTWVELLMMRPARATSAVRNNDGTSDATPPICGHYCLWCW